jgi:uncharacterized protein (TIGR00369 family)
MLDHVPHAKAVGMTVVSVERGAAVLKLPYDERLVGNPDTGVVHGGVITTLLDNSCGIAVGASLNEMRPIATLDLRIDYMKPATPKLDIFARAECYKTTTNIAFVRACAYHDDPNDPIATAVGAFMLNTAIVRPKPDAS